MNNSGLISFGSRRERYCWSEINGGVLEQMSYCIHMNYSGVPVTEQQSALSCDEIAEARKQYYQRSYNRDSSCSVAISLPYRLWESHYPDLDEPLYPKAWNILEEEKFTGTAGREYLCRMLNGQPKRGWGKTEKAKISIDGTVATSVEMNNEKDQKYREETRRLAEWEQLHWARWMITRGYLPVTFRQAESYRKDTGRHQLYLARVHPCITTDEELKSLGEKLDQDFLKFNCDSIQMTEDFLSLSWLEKEKDSIGLDQKNTCQTDRGC
ncbi:MAG: hypothetical protein MR332_03765 [Fusicatenibacter sp.]|nr:hypothetical protein [Fusicatenibacter sp.]